MRPIPLLLCGLVAAALALPAQAADSRYQSGQQLNARQMSALGNLPVYAVDQRQYRLLPQKTSDGASLLVNAQGAVFSSHNEILITGASENAVQLGAQQGPPPASVQHFAATGITVVRYADFPAAASGLAHLRRQLPAAVVRLGLEQGQMTPY
ncbi:hypothetical protein ACMHYJ_02630 [Castellaniella hirudinis]|uniref:hypothetical protein n=1 Tax=Castellaniella hirudinis TaxID=1144617 RepID=UPI0039C30AED